MGFSNHEVAVIAGCAYSLDQRHIHRRVVTDRDKYKDGEAAVQAQVCAPYTAR